MSETPTATPADSDADGSVEIDSDADADARSSRIDAAPASDLTQFQLNLLAAIADADPDPETGERIHGLGIREELEPLYAGKIHHGRLYPNLDSLCDKGLVKKTERDKRTNEYSLTARGERELVADVKWRVEMVQTLVE